MTGFVSKEKCETWNMLHNTGSTVASIANSSDSVYGTVKEHVNRECEHFEDFEDRRRIYSDECEAITEAVMEDGYISQDVINKFNRARSALTRHATSNCHHDTPEVKLSDYITQEECNMIRYLYRQENTLSEVADKLSISDTSAKKHSRGRCTHDNEIEPVTKSSRANNVTEDMCIYMRYCYYEEAMDPENVVDAVVDFFGLEKEISESTAKKHIRFNCTHD